jgi:hypothetical protein
MRERNPSLLSAQEWREQLLWQRECQLQLDANLDGLKKLYQALILSKVKKVSQEDMLWFMTQGCAGLKVSEQTAHYCYAMS